MTFLAHATNEPASGAFEPALAQLCEQVGHLACKVDALHELLSQRQKAHYLVEEVAAMSGRSPYTVRRWITQGRLKAVRIESDGPRGRLLIPRAELERLIANGRGSEIPGT